jgi:hypothetical protein
VPEIGDTPKLAGKLALVHGQGYATEAVAAADTK